MYCRSDRQRLIASCQPLVKVTNRLNWRALFLCSDNVVMFKNFKYFFVKMWKIKIWINLLKGQSNEIFDLQFISSIKPAWATDQWVQILSNLVKFSPRYSNFSEYITALSESPCSMILRWVSLPAVWYCAESVSPQYDTALSQSFRRMKLRWVNLSAEWNCAESVKSTTIS